LLIKPDRMIEWQGPSDHIPLASKISLPSELEEFVRVSIKKGSDVEMQFVDQLIRGLEAFAFMNPNQLQRWMPWCKL